MFFENDHKLVSMTERIEGQKTAPLRRIEAYWQRLSKGAIPRRSEIDPREIENELEYAFIAERIGSGLAKLRVAGSHLNDLMGMDTSGMPVSALLSPTSRTWMSETLTRFFEEPGVTRLRLSGETGIGKPKLTAEMVLAPLCSDAGDLDRALGGLVSTGRIGRTPRRLTITSVSHCPMSEMSIAPASAPVPTPLQHFAEPAAPFEPAPGRTERKHPYLRLIVSNDD